MAQKSARSELNLALIEQLKGGGYAGKFRCFFGEESLKADSLFRFLYFKTGS